MSTEQRRTLAATIPTTEVIKDAVTFPRDRLGEPLDISPERFDAWLARVRRDAAREALAQAEHRIVRLEAQTSIRGRAVIMYRERAREAEERIKAVRGIHTGTAWPGVADKPICDACDQMWPCPTIRALD